MRLIELTIKEAVMQGDGRRMKLLDTTGGNTKLKKSGDSSDEYRLAG